ncbi:hypothetical protein F511_06659 [Dorcoceras hygrometricum]|uniref:tRNA pseudouridine synthase n=1 Tax=Dorcoceras hygrometricum TaxID=472368 RepID=A0A2Z7B5L3_9LAMI|nr:hypothetical protein F511_06659 [Dorcoceras hygrometricum]
MLVVAGLRLRRLMEIPALPPTLPRNDYLQYNHTDACSLDRWTARESHQFMYARPWQMVNDFYSDAVNGRRSTSELFGKQTCAIHGGAENVEDCDQSVSSPAEDRAGRWARVTFKIVLSYHGGSFDGWQKQLGLNTVQGLVESSLGKFADEKKMQLLKEKKLPMNVSVVVAGRTDKGVTALNQRRQFDSPKLLDTWRKDVVAQDIENAINEITPGKIRAISVSKVSREFHPNFSAKWRHYLYVFPLHDGTVDDPANKCKKDHYEQCVFEKNNRDVLDDDYKIKQETRKKPTGFEVNRVNNLLNQLEGKLLSYKIFARDTKASRNVGPPTKCFVFHARASQVNLACDEDGTIKKAMCVELVANRFLRKMVRVLVATAVREAAAGAEDDILLKLMDATCRRATAPPAPPDGLCLLAVGYTDFDRNCCLIH